VRLAQYPSLGLVMLAATARLYNLISALQLERAASMKGEPKNHGVESYDSIRSHLDIGSSVAQTLPTREPRIISKGDKTKKRKKRSAIDDIFKTAELH